MHARIDIKSCLGFKNELWELEKDVWSLEIIQINSAKKKTS